MPVRQGSPPGSDQGRQTSPDPHLHRPRLDHHAVVRRPTGLVIAVDLPAEERRDRTKRVSLFEVDRRRLEPEGVGRPTSGEERGERENGDPNAHDFLGSNGPLPSCSRIGTNSGWSMARRCQFAPSTTSVHPVM